MIRLTDESKDEEVKEESKIDLMSMLTPEEELRLTGIYGDVNEERCSEAAYGLYALDSTALSSAAHGGDSENTDPPAPKPISFIVSSHGGLATEMFSIYDVIREIRERTPIHTKGIGKVMSAGVLLLAAGTKGQRRIGKFCRVMIHGVIAGQHGYIADVKNEFQETKYIQKMYIKALAEETNMTESYIRRLMNKKTNVYLNAEESVKLGIADIIF